MKTILVLIRHTTVLLLLSALHPQLSTAFAQGTAFTYQGRLNDGASPANGSYDFRFRVAMDPFANDYAAPAILTNSVPVANGLFTVTLDFGGGVFTGAGRWLEIALRTNGAGAYSTLSPRQPLTATPHAIIANSASNLLGALPANQLSGALPSAQLAGTYSGAVIFNNAANSFAGGGSGLTNVNASALGGLSASGFWKLSGNTVAPGQFIGSTNNQALELRANGYRVLRLEPDPGESSGNLIGGYTNNLIEQPGSGGNVIAGGGFSAGINVVRSNSRGNFIGGGSGHQIGPNLNDSFIGGGGYNSIQTNASRAAIGGGYSNVIHVGASSSTIGGGFRNRVQGPNATVGGGERNAVTAHAATVSGGSGNLASNSVATVSGGLNNTASGVASTVAGGAGNSATGDYSFAAGWVAQANHDGSFVWSDFSSGLHFGSGTANEFAVRANGGVRLETGGAGLTVDGARVPVHHATINDATHSNIVNVVNGSPVNFISDGVYGATIAGGGAENYLGFGNLTNSVGGDFGTVSGGGGNKANGVWATVAGGYRNTSSGFGATVGGGRQNTNSGASATIAGGDDNFISGGAAIIGGGHQNMILTNAHYSTIGGGSFNMIHTDAWSTTIGGGYRNTIQTDADNSTIGGGAGNTIELGAYSTTIGGGSQNTIQANAVAATIGGGAGNTIQTNAVEATIGGGYQNTIQPSAWWATIPGGYNNSATSFAFAAGSRAKANHTGSFVWADPQQADFASTGNNQFCIRAGGGVRLNTDTSIFFGSTTRQMLNLWGTEHAVGVQNGATYFRTGDGFAWFKGGQHVNAQDDPGPGGTRLMLLNSGGLEVNGALVPSSDRNAKENFKTVDAREVLEKVIALPLSSWNYKVDTATRHVGPMAQDFYAAFGVGPDDKHIATVDADGVALAAIQGLNQKVEKTRAENAELRRELSEIKRLLRNLSD